MSEQAAIEIIYAFGAFGAGFMFFIIMIQFMLYFIGREVDKL